MQSLRQPLVVDSLLAAAYAIAALVIGQEAQPGAWHSLDGRGALLTLLISGALVARRIFPAPVLCSVVVLWLVYIAAGYWPVVNSPSALLALYSVAAACRPRTTGACAAAVAAAWVLTGLLYSADYASMDAVVVQAIAFPAGVVLLGRTAGIAAERSRRLAAMTHRLRAEQEARARQAVTEERVRIARELHDVVAHHMSVVSLHAGMASYVFAADPETAREALGTIAATSREALEELRRLLVLLRETPDPAEPDAGNDGREAAGFAPAPGLDRLDELLSRVRAAGVPVELQVEGTPFRLRAGMDLCAYRVIQEALTNVLKHAAPASVTVGIRYEAQSVSVRVTDNGTRPASVDSGAPVGHGLIGMRERARIYQGTVSAGPRPEGGFEVQLSLPGSFQAQ